MKKIPNLFKLAEENPNRITQIKNPACDWVFEGSGKAGRLYEGTLYMHQYNKMYREHVVKENEIMPDVFILVWSDTETGDLYGWTEVLEGEHDYHLAGSLRDRRPGVYVLNGGEFINIYDTTIYDVCPRTYNGLCEWFKTNLVDGILFMNCDGRLAKVTRKQFGL